jgi:hypothetical protein
VRLWSSLGGLGLCAALLLPATAAFAEDPPENEQFYPVVYSQRPLTLSQMTLELNAGMDGTRLIKTMSARELETRLSIDAGAGFGITRNLEVRASIATLQITPKVGYGNPSIGATYRFLNSGLEMGARLNVTLVTSPDTILAVDKIGGILEPSVPFLVHFGSSARLDFGAGLPITIQKGKPVMVGLNAPVEFAFNIVDALHLGLRSSVYINDFKLASRYLTIPLGFFAGISFGSEKPFIEIDPFFTWPQFAQPGAMGANAKKINIDIYTVGAAVRLFLFL